LQATPVQSRGKISKTGGMPLCCWKVTFEAARVLWWEVTWILTWISSVLMDRKLQPRRDWKRPRRSTKKSIAPRHRLPISDESHGRAAAYGSKAGRLVQYDEWK
jgi:hypothetical protein